MPDATPQIELKPNPALVDEFVTIRLSGLAPDQPVTIRARLVDEHGQTWESQATFLSDSEGAVTVGAQRPRTGTYRQADPMGLFWAMSPEPRLNAHPFSKKTQDPITMTFTAEVDGQAVAAADLERLFVMPDLIRTPLRENGLVGTFFMPPENGPRPAIIVLGGSEGGLQENAAALLASCGYAALALAYFGLEHLPKKMRHLPLEYFETAIDWLQKQDGVDGERLGVIGGSKGGELALLLGATFPQIKAVVAYVPSAVMFEAIDPNPLGNLRRNAAPWQYRGEPLPYVPYKVSLSYLGGLLWRWIGGRSVSVLPAYQAGLKDPLAVMGAVIPVEKINGPVLLVSGEDDQTWPSRALSDMVIERLAEHEHPHPYEHLTYDGAGHMLWFADTHTPSTITVVPFPMRTRLDYGGNPQANAFARADSWARVQQFLVASLGGG